MAEIDPTRAVVHDAYSDDYIRDILRNVKTIAMVGASDNWNRPSYFAMKYLQQKGYRVYPVNPKVAAAGGEILGEKAYADLKDLPETADMVDVFRNSAAAGPVTDAAIEHGTKVVWMQLGVRNDEAAERAEEAGIQVVMNRCPKIEYGRLNSELSWGGFDSKVITAKRRRVRSL
jgi:predicted CoA-binding protein